MHVQFELKHHSTSERPPDVYSFSLNLSFIPLLNEYLLSPPHIIISATDPGDAARNKTHKALMGRYVNTQDSKAVNT